MNIVVFDFEVFKYDVLLGAIVLDNDNKETLVQLWDQDEIRQFYNDHLHDLWVGHNNLAYDNGILEAILEHKDPYKTSRSIINGSKIRKKFWLKIATYDIASVKLFSLKASELAAGKNIHTTDVDFNLDRPLTQEEKLLTEDYNKDDLAQTLFNLNDCMAKLSLRLDLVNEFGLSINAINYTEAKIAGTVLGAKNIEGIELMHVKPKMYDTLQIKNQEVIDYYLSEGFRQNKSINVVLCGAEHKVASGGIHAAVNKVHERKIMYFDVSGYYNLVMINYDLLPRTIPPEGRQKYIDMYHEQLKLKKVNPRKRNVYKTILLSVFGAMMNEYTTLYDPQRGSLVTMTGELFLIDLLEKLEGLGKVIQSNTDGVMFVPFDWNDEQKIWGIVEAWEKRTGFVIKKEVKYNLYQRDVNNYCFSLLEDNSPMISQPEKRRDYTVCRGEAVGSYWQKITNSTTGEFYNLKEPKIICHGIVDFLQYGITPEQTVEAYKNDLRFFQYCCKKMSYQYCTYDWIDENDIKHSIKIPHINRVFALKSSTIRGMLYKHKVNDDGKLSTTKIPCLPGNVFIYNESIEGEEIAKKLSSLIDWQYYIDRIYDRIKEFITVPTIRSFNHGQTN